MVKQPSSTLLLRLRPRLKDLSAQSAGTESEYDEIIHHDRKRIRLALNCGFVNRVVDFSPHLRGRETRHELGHIRRVETPS